MECYICAQPIDTNAVRPCLNEKCTGRVHKYCINEQYKFSTSQNELLCGNCKSPIVINKKITGFNKKDCLVYYAKITYLFVLLIGGPILMWCLAMGNSLFKGLPYWCLSYGPLGFFVFPFYLFIYWQIPRGVCNYKDDGGDYHKDGCFVRCNVFTSYNEGEYLSITLLFIISSFLLGLSHYIGSYMIYKSEFFTCESYMWGTFTYLIVGLVILVGSVFIFVAINCYQNTKKKFLTEELELGVAMENYTVYGTEPQK